MSLPFKHSLDPWPTRSSVKRAAKHCNNAVVFTLYTMIPMLSTPFPPQVPWQIRDHTSYNGCRGHPHYFLMNIIPPMILCARLPSTILAFVLHPHTPSDAPSPQQQMLISSEECRQQLHHRYFLMNTFPPMILCAGLPLIILARANSEPHRPHRMSPVVKSSAILSTKHFTSEPLPPLRYLQRCKKAAYNRDGFSDGTSTRKRQGLAIKRFINPTGTIVDEVKRTKLQ